MHTKTVVCHGRRYVVHHEVGEIYTVVDLESTSKDQVGVMVANRHGTHSEWTVTETRSGVTRVFQRRRDCLNWAAHDALCLRNAECYGMDRDALTQELDRIASLYGVRVRRRLRSAAMVDVRHWLDGLIAALGQAGKLDAITQQIGYIIEWHSSADYHTPIEVYVPCPDGYYRSVSFWSRWWPEAPVASQAAVARVEWPEILRA